MPKFSGAVGYGLSVKTAPGVWVPQIEERRYRGDVLQKTHRWQDGESANPDLILSNKISIVGDEFANANLGAMRYVQWRGVRWDIKTIEVKPPRIILYLGGVYNGEVPTETSGES